MTPHHRAISRAGLAGIRRSRPSCGNLARSLGAGAARWRFPSRHSTNLGFRRRPEPWNQVENTGGRQWPKLVFAPPIGERAANVHVRESGSATARRNLLFRDFLRADEPARVAWGSFKQRLAQTTADLYDYGQIKQPATDVLMIAAENWARRAAWIDPSR